MLKIGRPNQCSVDTIHNPVGLELLTRLRLGLCHLNEHRIINEVLGSITKISDPNDCAFVKVLLFGDQNYTL